MIYGVAEIFKLCTITIIENEILLQTSVGITHIKIGILNTIDGLSACWLCTGPCAIEVIDITPLIEVKIIPACLILYKNGESIVDRRCIDFFYTSISNPQV